MKADAIRSLFLKTFADHGHEVVASASLLPHNDPTLFFVNAGMVPFKDAFTGAEVRAHSRATSAQKCLRVSGKHNDLDNVGRTPRHHTFFEMLGNFSFGDYFKAEAIPFAWGFLTDTLGIDPARLWITIHHTDDEADALWRALPGVDPTRIQRLGDKDNFWSMGDTGPCGPCTEIHYDHGPAFGPEGGPASESPRYIEIWNLVFMQFDQAADGSRTLLPEPSIDTGMGLERLAAVLQGAYSNYDTDLFQPLIQRAARLAGVAYGAAEASDTALRVIADHARATAFLIADGVMPSNEGRGYVLRRIMRRAIRFGVTIDLVDAFLHHITSEVVDRFGHAYPDLVARRGFIGEVVQAEEERFRRTLDRGTRLLDEAIARVGHGGTLPGDVAFTLSDTYGFPLDLTELIAEEHGVAVDAAGYDAALAAQQARGREAWKGSGEEAVGALWHSLAATHGATAFTGYDSTEGAATVLAIVRADADGTSTQVDALHAGERGVVLLDRTPLYGESGGQVGDTGRINAEGVPPLDAEVTDTRKAAGLHLHEVTVRSGTIREGAGARVEADGRRRDHIRRNHTATHLLHAALREVLGDHVTQKGSLVAPERLRFDFAHHKPVSASELAAIEDRVNAQILRNSALSTRVMALDEAKAAGAMALFGEKYDASVRTVDVPGFSFELCGGTHVARTGDIGLFSVVSEGGVAAGIRRIEAVTGHGALAAVRRQQQLLAESAGRLRTGVDALPEAIERLQADRKAAQREIDSLRAEIARAAADDLVRDLPEIGGVKLVAARFDGDLKAQADRLRDQLGSAVVVLASAAGGKAQLLVAATADIAPARLKAGDVIKAIAPLIGGRGGGRPDMAQAGGSDPSGIDAALDAARAAIRAALEASA